MILHLRLLNTQSDIFSRSQNGVEAGFAHLIKLVFACHETCEGCVLQRWMRLGEHAQSLPRAAKQCRLQIRSAEGESVN